MGQKPCCAQGQGLPSALSNIRDCLHPSRGSQPSATQHGWATGGIRACRAPPGAAVGSSLLPRGGTGGQEAGAWQSRQGLSTAVRCQARPAPLPVSTGSAPTAPWHHPLGRIKSSLNSMSLPLHTSWRGQTVQKGLR